MNDPKPTRRRDDEDWQGFREVDRAIAENRVSEYRWKKAWADPWERRALIATVILIAAFIIYIAIYDGVL